MTAQGPGDVRGEGAKVPDPNIPTTRQEVEEGIDVGPSAKVAAIGKDRDHAEFKVATNGRLIIHIEDVAGSGPFDIETSGPNVFVKVGTSQTESSGQIIKVVAYRTESSDVIVDSNC